MKLRRVSGETLAEIFSLSAKVLWDRDSRTLLAPARGSDPWITKNMNIPKWHPAQGGCVPRVCGATLFQNGGFSSAPFFGFRTFQLGKCEPRKETEI